MSATLTEILRRNRAYHPEYRRGLSNHLSMGVRSLAALGADDAQLAAFADTMWPRLEPAGDATAFTRDSWTQHLGDRAQFAAHRGYFEAAIAERGVAAVLRESLPVLMPGVGAAAFHCVIRTGYGVRFDDPAETADGLAYWAIAHQPLGALEGDATERDPLVLLDAVSRDTALAGEEIDAGLIFQAMDIAAERPGFAAAASALRVDDASLARIADAVIRLFAATGDFTALHAVTGTHAMRALQPYAPADAARWLWQALVAAYITIGAPRVEPAPRDDVPAWETIVTKARASLNEHDIKLVDVAREEEAAYGGAWYRHAAARRMRLLEES